LDLYKEGLDSALLIFTMETKLEKELRKYYEGIGKIKVLNKSHKEIINLIYPLLKELDFFINTTK